MTSQSGSLTMYRDITRLLSRRLEMLRLRGEITMSNYWLSLDVLHNTSLFQQLVANAGGVGTLLVFTSLQTYNIVADTVGDSLVNCYLLSLPVTPRMTVLVQEAARGIVDEFSVLLKSLVCGMVSSFPKIVGVEIGIGVSNLYFPGALTWTIKDLMPMSVANPPFLLVVGMATDSMFTTPESQVALVEDIKLDTVANTIGQIVDSFQQSLINHGANSQILERLIRDGFNKLNVLCITRVDEVEKKREAVLPLGPADDLVVNV